MSIADHVTQIYTNMAEFIMRRHMSSIYFVKPSFFKKYFFLAFAFFWLFFAQHLLFISDKADPPPTTGNKIRRCLHIWCSLEFIVNILPNGKFTITAQASSQRTMDFKDYLTSQQQNIYVVLFKNEQESIIRF